MATLEIRQCARARVLTPLMLPLERRQANGRRSLALAARTRAQTAAVLTRADRRN